MERGIDAQLRVLGREEDRAFPQDLRRRQVLPARGAHRHLRQVPVGQEAARPGRAHGMHGVPEGGGVGLGKPSVDDRLLGQLDGGALTDVARDPCAPMQVTDQHP